MGISNISINSEVLGPVVSFTHRQHLHENDLLISPIYAHAISNTRARIESHARNIHSTTTPGAGESRRGKKRLRYEEDWTRKKRKLQKDRGESYSTYKGERRPV